MSFSKIASLFKRKNSALTMATIRLFNAVQIFGDQKYDIAPDVLQRGIRNGYILDSRIKTDGFLLDTIEKIVGISGEKANAAFHKSWAVIKNTNVEVLVLQQIAHYATTYGYTNLGIYNKNTVYIPSEVLGLPVLEDDLPLVVIKGMTSDELLQRILDLGSGVALSPQSLADIVTIIKSNEYEPEFLDKILNRELRTLLFDLYEMVPSEPVEYLRFLVQKMTGETLLIKNAALIAKIKESDYQLLDSLLVKAPANLASIFYRFKPLFLAMKSVSHNKSFFNKLRKNAVKEHKPLKRDYLNSVTELIKNHELDYDTLSNHLESASVYRKVRLANALNYRLNANNSSIVYRIRNGLGWATNHSWNEQLNDDAKRVFELVIDSIVADISPNVSGKQIYIPDNVFYGLPSSEKQFTGNLPSGSYVKVPNDLIVGIHWFNTKRSIDLDLSVIDVSGKIGWDTKYSSDDNQVLFSGDMTDAPQPKGATELFYIGSSNQDEKLLLVNYYNYSKDDVVDCKIIAAHEGSDAFCENYMVDVSKIIAQANIQVSKHQNIIGLVASVDDELRVYFSNMSVGCSISASSAKAYVTQAREYLFSYAMGAIDLRSVLIKAGAEVLGKQTTGEDYIDLSPQNLTKDSILSLIQ
jgi:hypothetical protein